MKKIKKLVVCFLCMGIICSMAGCGSQDDHDVKDNTTNDTQSDDSLGGAIDDGVEDIGDAVDDGVDDVTDGVDDITDDLTGNGDTAGSDTNGATDSTAR